MKPVHPRHWFFMAACLFCGLPAATTAAGHTGHGDETDAVSTTLSARCQDPASLPAPDCGLTPNSAFDRNGQLWTAFVQHGHVYLARAGANGTGYATAVAVNAQPEPVYTNGENRPKLAFGPQGDVYVSWTRKLPGMYAGDIRFSRSVDGAASFAPVQTVNNDGALISHRFDDLIVDATGNVYLLWLDKRDQAAAREHGQDYTGAALYYAVSGNRGIEFPVNRKVADHSCECCRIASTLDNEQHVVALWRQVFAGDIRDHAIATLGVDKVLVAPRRATVDNWHTDSCPHHGPDLAAAADGMLHMVWFSQGTQHKGLFYGRINPRSGAADRIRQLDAAPGAAHPQVLVSGDRIIVAWKSFDGTQTRLLVSESSDGGLHWTASSSIATTATDSDYPQLLTDGKQVYAGWQSAAEGYRLLPVNQPAEVQHAEN
jgi:hypothetical protein